MILSVLDPPRAIETSTSPRSSKMNSSAFQAKQAHDRFIPERSSLNMSPANKRNRKHETERLTRFQDYLRDEVTQVSEMKRFVQILRDLVKLHKRRDDMSESKR